MVFSLSYASSQPFLNSAADAPASPDPSNPSLAALFSSSSELKNAISGANQASSLLKTSPSPTTGTVSSWKSYVEDLWLQEVSKTLGVKAEILEKYAPIFKLLTGKSNPAALLLGTSSSGSATPSTSEIESVYSGLESILQSWNVTGTSLVSNWLDLFT